jgi:diguanylate cyclase (GGDEF)-like protein
MTILVGLLAVLAFLLVISSFDHRHKKRLIEQKEKELLAESAKLEERLAENAELKGALTDEKMQSEIALQKAAWASFTIGLYNLTDKQLRVALRTKLNDVFQGGPWRIKITLEDFEFDVGNAPGKRNLNFANMVEIASYEGVSFYCIQSNPSIKKRDEDRKDYYEDLVKALQSWAIGWSRGLSLKNRAEVDGPTGLKNRYVLDDGLKKELARTIRYPGHVFSLVMVDLDDLKLINDGVGLGHTAGNQALSKIASVMRRHARGSDVVARIGGDEFAVLLPETGCTGAHIFAEEIRDEVEKAYLEYDGVRVPLTVSIGVACYPESASDLEELWLVADRRLYMSKHGGKNKVTGQPEDQPKMRVVGG